jgi:hypothetical protein
MRFGSPPAVLLDIGGVLETTPSLGTADKWEAAFGLLPGQMAERAHEVWEAGAVGSISEDDVHRRLAVSWAPASASRNGTASPTSRT